jgi:effector-binding domain-containing protein
MSPYSVQLQDSPSIPLAVIRRRAAAAELAKLVPECCGLVWSAVKAQNTKAGRHVAVYWNDDIQLEVGVELQGQFVERDPVVLSALPGGTVAAVTHFGPYNGLGRAHDAIHAWCKANGHRLAGPRWEIYGHWQEAWNSNPALIRTDVFHQVAKVAE